MDRLPVRADRARQIGLHDRRRERSDRTPRSIYRHDTRSTEQAPVHLVARSHRIEIRSLRRKDDRIYWKQAGQIRRASLR